jgi:formate dehydrogenase subunit delta
VNSLQKLVMMANQIAANLMQELDPAAATAEHIRLFWDPRMKSMICEDGVAGLSSMAAAAVDLLNERDLPQARSGIGGA